MRTDWDTYFIQLAHQAATRATCPRLSVGAVLVKNNKIVSTGYNGAPSKQPHCTDVGCLMVNGSCKRTIHAEENAILHSSRLDRAGSTLYVTDTPCLNCARKIATSGIAEVVFDRDYIAQKLADPATPPERIRAVKEWWEDLLHLMHENGIVIRRNFPG